MALIQLFEGTGGTSWTNSTGWGTSAPLGEWYGVNVDHEGRVIELHLAGRLNKGNNLRGGCHSLDSLTEKGQRKQIRETLSQLLHSAARFRGIAGVRPCSLSARTRCSTRCAKIHADGSRPTEKTLSAAIRLHSAVPVHNLKRAAENLCALRGVSNCVLNGVYDEALFFAPL